ncbi:hypothetical protein T11_4677 [Trichinella zimbabwensis]|uniref:Uncharacterized protein n=1 Tax=Trichinella zimbabwensis TaxID=268475 RepID=A0A0V1GEQ1_9BILA|nr:hypothetical protein T11_4677 [Trichinella zimbabwensis]
MGCSSCVYELYNCLCVPTAMKQNVIHMKRHFVLSLKKNGFLGINSAYILIVHNKWLPTSEYNCRFVCAVMFTIIKLYVK